MQPEESPSVALCSVMFFTRTGGYSTHRSHALWLRKKEGEGKQGSTEQTTLWNNGFWWMKTALFIKFVCKEPIMNQQQQKNDTCEYCILICKLSYANRRLFLLPENNITALCKVQTWTWDNMVWLPPVTARAFVPLLLISRHPSPWRVIRRERLSWATWTHYTQWRCLLFLTELLEI
jgi:hypothetical protein